MLWNPVQRFPGLLNLMTERDERTNADSNVPLLKFVTVWRNGCLCQMSWSKREVTVTFLPPQPVSSFLEAKSGSVPSPIRGALEPFQ